MGLETPVIEDLYMLHYNYSNIGVWTIYGYTKHIGY